jgi:O-antigen/teichoic acid export membrane protein
VSETIANPRRTSLIVSALSNWFPLVVNTAVGLLLTPFVVAQVGKKDYGMWSLVMSFVGYYGLLRLSVGTGVMRYVPFYAGRRDHEAVSQIVSTGLALFTVVGVIIWVVSALIAGPVGRFFKGGHELSTLVWITGIAAAAECPMRIFDAALRARERWVTANIITVANALIYAGGITACLLTGYGVVQMAWTLVAANILALALSTVALVKLCPEIHLGTAMVKWHRLRELLAFGVLTVVGTMAYSMSLQNHRLIIGKLVSLEAVAVYAIAALLIEKVRNVVGAPLQVAWPRFALLDGEKDHDGVIRLFHKTTRYSAILACGVVLPVLLVGPAFIRLWMGDDFESAGSVLVVLGLGCLIEGTFYANGSLLGGTGRQGVQAIFATVEAVCGFTLSIVLGWKIGLVGVAWGYTIFAVLIRGLVSTWYVCRLLKMGVIDYCLGTFWRPWLILAAILAAGYLVRAPEHAGRWVSWLGLALVVTGLYGVATYLLVLSREDKERVLNVLRRVPSFV